MENIERMVQIGIVTAVDITNNKARVKFRDVDMTSDWLYVLQRPNTQLCVNADVKLKGDSSEETNASVTVNGTAEKWLPKINDTVVVLYLPIFNGDGFILGAI